MTKVDPTVVEKLDSSNSFKTRVYPVFPMSTRKIKIGYQEQINMDDNGDFFYRVISGYEKLVSNFSVTISVISDKKPIVTDDRTSKELSLSASESGFSYSFTILNDTPKASISIKVPAVVGNSSFVTSEGDQE